jgi:16S rRNA processing protein RimM
MPEETLVIIGEILKPIGLRGELKIKPFTESFEVFQNSTTLYFGGSEFEVRRIRFHHNHVVVSIDGIGSREEAERLRGALVKTSELNFPATEDDEYYFFQLLGMTVVTSDGEDLGHISEITPTAANAVLHVKSPRGEILLPMIDEVVLDVDLAERKITVDLLEGLAPDA